MLKSLILWSCVLDNFEMKLYKSEVLLAGREKERERECDKNFILKLPTLDQSEASIQVTWVLSTNQSTGKTAKRERESFYRNFLAEKTFGFCVSQNFFQLYCLSSSYLYPSFQAFVLHFYLQFRSFI